MATKENEYKEDIANKKQQTRVPDPTKGEGSNGDGQGGTKIKLTSGAVPPVKVTNAAPAPATTSVAPVETAPVLADLKVEPKLAQANPPVVDGNNVQQNVNVTGQKDQQVQDKKPEVKQGEVTDNNVATVPKNDEVETNNVTATNNPPQPLFKTDPKVGEEFANEVTSWGLNGNVDFTERPMVEGAEPMEIGDGEDPNGAYKMADGKSYAHNVVLTPVRKNGATFTPEQLKGYWDTLVQTSKDLEKDGIYVSPMELDKDGEALIVGTDTPADITGKMGQAYQKYYVGGAPQGVAPANQGATPSTDAKKETVETGTNIPTNTAKVPQNQTTGETGENIADKGSSVITEKNQQTDVKNTASAKSVDDYKKDYANDTKEELEWKLNARKGVQGIDPNDVTALEQLIAEKGEAATDATPTKDGTPDFTEEEVLSDVEKAAKAEAKQSLHAQYSSGSNKDLIDLPIASEAKMIEAGWVGASGKGNQMLYPVIVTVADSKGKKHKVLMSPILSNGAVMTQDDFKAYVDNLDEMDDIMGVDKAGCGLIIKMDATDADLEALDALEADIVKGEKPSLMTLDEEEKVDSENDPVSDNYDSEVAKAKEALKAAEELLANPTKSPKGVFIEENNKQKEEFDKETEEIKKKQKRSRLIAGIGDLLQVLLNSTGAFLGAKSADLTSLSGAAAKAGKEELTLREKRRNELVKNMDTENLKFIKNLEKDVDYWRKHLDELNKEANKYKADKAKAFRNAKMKEAAEKQKTVEQGKRRVAESKTRILEKREASKLKKDEIAFKGQVQKEVNAANNAGKAAVKATPSHSIVEHRGSGGSGGKSGKGK